MKIITPVTITDPMLVSSSIAETDAAAWNAATSYATDALVMRTSTHSVYKRLAPGGFTATAPESDATNWVRVGPTNRWKMFDRATGTVSTAASSLSFTIAPGLVRGIALLDMVGTSVTVTMSDGATTVYTRTVSLLSSAGITDWYSYFFAPVVFKQTLVLDDLPPYTNGEITVTLTGSGDVGIGTVAVGEVLNLGQTLHGLGLGIIDYSIKSTDGFGTTTVTRRAYAKRMNAQIKVAASDVDEVGRRLSLIRADPVVWVGSSSYAQSVVYGFYKDWSIDVRYPDYSFCSLTVEGLS